jgi:putative peptidoglycan lipid II flippase
LPAATGLAVLATPILITLFHYQAFDMADVTMSSLSLMAYASGLPAFIAVKVLAPGYYARQDTRTPVKIAITAMVSNMVLNLLFVGLMLHWHFQGPHAGLALASSLAAYLNAGLLYRGLRKQQHYRPAADWPRLFLSVVFACVVMAAAINWWIPEATVWAGQSAVWRAGSLLTVIVLGVISYGISALIAGVRPGQFVRGAN